MAYTLKIERTDGEEITLDQWREAVDAIEGVRNCTNELHNAKNPMSGAIMSMPVSAGDAEMFDSEINNWRFCFRWDGSAVAFNARVLERVMNGDLSDPLWLVVKNLARRLQASIVGEEGEVYNDDFQVIR